MFWQFFLFPNVLINCTIPQYELCWIIAALDRLTAEQFVYVRTRNSVDQFWLFPTLLMILTFWDCIDLLTFSDSVDQFDYFWLCWSFWPFPTLLIRQTWNCYMFRDHAPIQISSFWNNTRKGIEKLLKVDHDIGKKLVCKKDEVSVFCINLSS